MEMFNPPTPKKTKLETKGLKNDKQHYPFVVAIYFLWL